MRRALIAASLGATAVALSAATAVGAALPEELKATPVARMPFPDRGYVVSIPGGAIVDRGSVGVRENGQRVGALRVTPLIASGIRFGVVLAIDASRSMQGAPYDAALEAAETFVRKRDEAAQLGLVAFNGQVEVVAAPTDDADTLLGALEQPPALGVGTRMYDALAESLRQLRAARMSAGTIVVLSDGDDVGSVQELGEVIAAAQRDRVRIFTVGLRSTTYDPSVLQRVADETGGAYAEAGSARELNAIYAAIGDRLASEYLVRYQSPARPESHVDVRIEIADHGIATSEYTAPTPAGLTPYEQSLVSRFVLSPASVVAIALLVVAVIGLLLMLLTRATWGRRPRMSFVQRVGQFSAPTQRLVHGDSAAARTTRAGAQYTRGWWAAFERDLRLARIERSPRQIGAITLAASGVCVGVLASFSMILAILGLVAPPFVARSVVRYKVRRLRDAFAEQLPTALQVLASALRAGHSFNGALGVVVENSAEPARSELRRVVRDDQLGVAPEVALRRMGARMANRDVDQVALLAELQRTSGGNAAEILDTIVETIRQRGELRRLIRSLTAQGRMARWILTALPVVLTIFLWFMQPEIMGAFFSSPGGQAATLAAVLLVAAGSLVIQRIIDIDV